MIKLMWNFSPPTVGTYVCLPNIVLCRSTNDFAKGCPMCAFSPCVWIHLFAKTANIKSVMCNNNVVHVPKWDDVMSVFSLFLSAQFRQITGEKKSSFLRNFKLYVNAIKKMCAECAIILPMINIFLYMG